MRGRRGIWRHGVKIEVAMEVVLDGEMMKAHKEVNSKVGGEVDEMWGVC